MLAAVFYIPSREDTGRGSVFIIIHVNIHPIIHLIIHPDNSVLWSGKLYHDIARMDGIFWHWKTVRLQRITDFFNTTSPASTLLFSLIS